MTNGMSAWEFGKREEKLVKEIERLVAEFKRETGVDIVGWNRRADGRSLIVRWPPEPMPMIERRKP